MGFKAMTNVSKGSSVPMLTEEVYDAVVHAVIDYGEQEAKFKDETRVRREIKIVFEIPSETDEEGNTRIVGYKRIAASLHEKSNFSSVLRTVFNMDQGALMHKLGDTEESLIAAFKDLLGKPVQIHIKTIKDTSIQFVDSVSRLDPRLPQPEAVQEGYVFSTDAKDAADVFTHKVTKGHQKIIAQALNVSEFSSDLQEAIIKSVEEAASANTGSVLG